MAVVTAADLQRRSAEVQRTASREPVFITHHDTPRYALLSLEDLVRTGAHRALLADGALPEGVRRRLVALGDCEAEARAGTYAEVATTSSPSLDGVRRVVADHADDLRSVGVASLWLFGSVARGSATPASDVDMIVSFEEGRRISFVDLGRVQIDLSDWLGRRVDVIRWSGIPPEAEARIRAEAVQVL